MSHDAHTKHLNPKPPKPQAPLEHLLDGSRVSSKGHSHLQTSEASGIDMANCPETGEEQKEHLKP